LKLFHNKIIVAIILFTIAFGIYSPSLKSGFVWDDFILLTKQRIDLSGKVNIFPLIPKIREIKTKFYYRPVVGLSWSIDHEVWDSSSFGFHFTNILFHAIASILFYIFALLVLREFRVERRDEIAFLSSLFFALYPMHVEAVSFISGRSDLFCLTFYLLGIIFHILSYSKNSKFGKSGFFIFGAVFFYLALLSKEFAVTFPIVTILFDLLARRISTRGSLLRNSAYILLLLISLLLRARQYIVFPELNIDVVDETAPALYQIWAVVETLFLNYFFYIKKLIFPFSLNPFIPSVPGGIQYLFPSVLLILVLLYVSYKSFRSKENITAFAVLWVLINLGPPSLVAIYSINLAPVMEKFLFLASAGFCLCLGYVLFAIGKRLRTQRIAWVSGIVVSLLFMFLTLKGQAVWKSNFHMWQYAAEKSGDHPFPHAMYGVALKLAGKRDEAAGEFLNALGKEGKGISGSIGKVTAAHYLGLFEIRKGNFDGAEKRFREALSYDRSYRGIFKLHMGEVYYYKGEARLLNNEDPSPYFKKAEEYLKKSIRPRKPRAKAHFLLGVVYFRLGDLDMAKKHSSKALKLGLTKRSKRMAQYILNSSRSPSLQGTNPPSNPKEE